VKKEDIIIRVTEEEGGQILTITGERKLEPRPTDAQRMYRERRT
jgi:hypothetical protein